MAMFIGQETQGEARRGQEEPGEARRGQEKPGEARSTRRGQEKPGDARRGQETPGDARRGQAKPGGARRGQVTPGDAKRGQKRPGEAGRNQKERQGEGRTRKERPGGWIWLIEPWFLRVSRFNRPNPASINKVQLQSTPHEQWSIEAGFGRLKLDLAIEAGNPQLRVLRAAVVPQENYFLV